MLRSGGAIWVCVKVWGVNMGYVLRSGGQYGYVLRSGGSIWVCVKVWGGNMGMC